MAATVLLSARTTDGNGSIDYWDGKGALFVVFGTFGGAAVNLDFSPDGGTTWLTLASVSIASAVPVAVPQSQIRAVVSGATGTTSLHAYMMKADVAATNQALILAAMSGLLTDTELRASPVGINHQQSAGVNVDPELAVPIKVYPQTAPSVANPRPGDVTPYSGNTSALAGDLVIATVFEFTGATQQGDGGSGRIRRYNLFWNTGAQGILRAHFYKVAPVPAVADNVAYLLTTPDPDDYIGPVDVQIDGGHLGLQGSASVDLPYNLPSGDSIFALHEARSNFTPGNAAILTAFPIYDVYD